MDKVSPKVFPFHLVDPLKGDKILPPKNPLTKMPQKHILNSKFKMQIYLGLRRGNPE